MTATSTECEVIAVLPKKTGPRRTTEREESRQQPGSETQKEVRTSPPRILLAEDDMEMRVLVSGQLRRAGYEVVECSDGGLLVRQLAATFLPSVRRNDFDLVISDIRMPGFSGLEILDGLHDRPGCPPMILITAFGTDETHERARQLGAVATIDKPFRIPDLVVFVHEVLKNSRRQSKSHETNGVPHRGSTAPEFPNTDR